MNKTPSNGYLRLAVEGDDLPCRGNYVIAPNKPPKPQSSTKIDHKIGSKAIKEHEDDLSGSLFPLKTGIFFLFLSLVHMVTQCFMNVTPKYSQIHNSVSKGKAAKLGGALSHTLLSRKCSKPEVGMLPKPPTPSRMALPS